MAAHGAEKSANFDVLVPNRLNLFKKYKFSKIFGTSRHRLKILMASRGAEKKVSFDVLVPNKYLKNIENSKTLNLYCEN